MTQHNKLWFKRRRYGWGWTPVTWQGWTAVIVFLLGVVVAAAVLVEDEPRNTLSRDGILFIVISISLALGLFWVSYVKGPSPKWRWGKRPGDSPDDDI